MKVPIDHHHAPETFLEQPRRGYRDIVEKAEAHRAVGKRVMSRRTDDRKGVVGSAFKDRFDRRQHAARGQQSGSIRVARGVGVGVEIVAVHVRSLLDQRDILGGVA